MSGILYFVPTPIGNLEDMTFRAVKILKEVDYILCEDTRTSGILLKHFEISKPLKSYHLHNEHQATLKVIEDLRNGQNIAIITDAGTPGISDPGYLLAKACADNEVEMQCLRFYVFWKNRRTHQKAPPCRDGWTAGRNLQTKAGQPLCR